jgi:hypothetical protein
MTRHFSVPGTGLRVRVGPPTIMHTEKDSQQFQLNKSHFIASLKLKKLFKIML